MKLNELVEKFNGLQMLQDGEFSSFGFCELHQTEDMLVYINSENYIQKAKSNPNVRAVLTTLQIAEHFLDTGLGLVITDDPASRFYELHNSCVRNGLLYHMSNQLDTVVGDQCQVSSQAYVAQKGVILGSRVVIEPGAVIMENVTIGDDCVIGANTVVGTRGFQFSRVGPKRVYIEHVGGVRIGNRVEILSGTTIACGLFEPTVIEDDVKIDNLVHIGHSDRIGSGTIITAGTKLSGTVHIGKDVWMGVNSSVVQRAEIGDGAFICMGSVVTRCVKAGAKVSGNFAEDHARRKMHTKRLENLLYGETSRD